MAKRSTLLKYQFVLGEVVLCFEPDPTKARVLYDAKILETAHLKAKTGEDFPAYRIHFQGWNSSWDRTVGENYILKSSEENRRLMKKLAETAKIYRNNRLRKVKINDILDKAFKHKPLVFDVEVDVRNDDSSDSSEDSHRKNVHNGTNNKNEMSDDDYDDDDDDSDDDDLEVELTIPKILREKLEEDFLMINKRNKLLRVPGEANVISVLEGYVKNFSINILYGLSNRWKLVGRNRQSSPDIKSIPMCREVVDGIRICFDFTLPTVLLYSFERDQFSSFRDGRCSNGQTTSSSPTKNSDSYAKTTSTRRTNRKTPRTKVPRLSRNCSEQRHRDAENSIDSDGLNVSEMLDASMSTPTASPRGRASSSSSSLCRRVTRQYVAETSKALREMRQRTRPGLRGRGRRKFKDCGFKRQNGQRKMASRGGYRGRRGRRPLVRSNRQDFGVSGVCNEQKMDCGLTATPSLEAREKHELADIKTEPDFDTTLKSATNDNNTSVCAMLSTSGLTTTDISTSDPAMLSMLFSTPGLTKTECSTSASALLSTPPPSSALTTNYCSTSAMLSTSFSTPGLTTNVPPSTPASTMLSTPLPSSAWAANDSSTSASAMLLTSLSTTELKTTGTATGTKAALPAASSPSCAFSAPLQLKVEGAPPSVSSSSGPPHPPHPMLLNAGSAASSVSSLPQIMDFDKSWPDHNLVKEVLHCPAAQSRIDEILSWKLLPPTVYSDCPPQPSLVCGPHHLLRLFVKLPELLGKMDLPDVKLDILVYYLENFLEYLASRHEDFFPVSAYVDAV